MSYNFITFCIVYRFIKKVCTNSNLSLLPLLDFSKIIVPMQYGIKIYSFLFKRFSKKYHLYLTEHDIDYTFAT